MTMHRIPSRRGRGAAASSLRRGGPLSRRLGAAAGLALLGLLVPALPAAAATLCLTDQLKYTNKGAYDVGKLGIVWVGSDGTKQEKPFDMKRDDLHGDVLNHGDDWTFDLRDIAPELGIEQGDEVWLKVYIYAGETKSCRKDDHKLVYDGGAGVLMKFDTAGTTMNDNSCKYSGDMSDNCKTGD
jgi:hypothetical protein